MLKRGRAGEILQEVLEVVSRWPGYAAEASVGEEHIEHVGRALRLQLPAG